MSKMARQTWIHDARERVESEQDAVKAKLNAIDQFIDRVEDITPAPRASSSAGITATVGALVNRSRSGDDTTKAVRQAFAETIRPHSLDDIEERESLQETIQAELNESIAAALAPTTNTSLSPNLKQAVLSEAGMRRAETKAVHRGLEREHKQLDEAAVVVDDIAEWIAAADKTPLADLGFEELQQRHERLASYRTQCQTTVEERQAFLEGGTNNGSKVRISHRSLCPYIYQSCTVNHPILATFARLDDVCADCQRAVGDHLVRRS